MGNGELLTNTHYQKAEMFWEHLLLTHLIGTDLLVPPTLHNSCGVRFLDKDSILPPPQTSRDVCTIEDSPHRNTNINPSC